MTTRTNAIHVEQLGRIEYDQAWQMQRRVFDGVLRGELPNTVLFCEHPDVITLGRNARTDQNLRQTRELLAINGYQVFDVDRGGDVTYHGPGQLVGYPIIRLADYREDLGWYMRSIEELIIRTLETYGLEATRKPGLTGVWVRDRKICAIGVRASRWVTMHGFAFNITTDLHRFNAIVPCGISGYDVTSLLNETGDRHSLGEVADRITDQWGDVFY